MHFVSSVARVFAGLKVKRCICAILSVIASCSFTKSLAQSSDDTPQADRSYGYLIGNDTDSETVGRVKEKARKAKFYAVLGNWTEAEKSYEEALKEKVDLAKPISVLTFPCNKLDCALEYAGALIAQGKLVEARVFLTNIRRQGLSEDISDEKIALVEADLNAIKALQSDCIFSESRPSKEAPVIKYLLELGRERFFLNDKGGMAAAGGLAMTIENATNGLGDRFELQWEARKAFAASNFSACETILWKIFFLDFFGFGPANMKTHSSQKLLALFYARTRNYDKATIFLEDSISSDYCKQGHETPEDRTRFVLQTMDCLDDVMAKRASLRSPVQAKRRVFGQQRFLDHYDGDEL